MIENDVPDRTDLIVRRRPASVLHQARTCVDCLGYASGPAAASSLGKRWKQVVFEAVTEWVNHSFAAKHGQRDGRCGSVSAGYLGRSGLGNMMDPGRLN